MRVSNHDVLVVVDVQNDYCSGGALAVSGHYARRVFTHFFPDAELRLLFDVSHNSCKVETHLVDGKGLELFVRRNGATRAFGPGHESLPAGLRAVGQPVLIGGSMGTGSYILVGDAKSEAQAFSSACHGAGRALSRHAALKQWSGRKIIDELGAGNSDPQSIIARHRRGSTWRLQGCRRGVAAAEHASLARRVARLRPLICVKG